MRTFGLGTEMKVLVDDPESGNPFEVAYGKSMTIVFYSVYAMLLLDVMFFLTDPPIISSMANQALCH